MEETNDWHLVFSKPRQEVTAVQNLQNQGFEAILPKAIELKRLDGRRVKIRGPLFPRYLFVKIREGVDDFSKIRSTRGCVDLVRFAGHPAKIPKQFLDGFFKEFSDLHDWTLDLTHGNLLQLNPGDAATVVAGPFEGIAVTVRALKPQERVAVLLDFMGGQRQVVLDSKNLEK